MIVSHFQPPTFDLALSQLVKLISEDEAHLRYLKGTMRCDYLVGTHTAFGRWLRNTWQLWIQDSPLVCDIEKRFGITHAKDCSSLLLGAVWDAIHEVPSTVEEDARGFLEYWAEVAVREAENQ